MTCIRKQGAAFIHLSIASIASIGIQVLSSTRVFIYKETTVCNMMHLIQIVHFIAEQTKMMVVTCLVDLITLKSTIFVMIITVYVEDE